MKHFLAITITFILLSSCSFFDEKNEFIETQNGNYYLSDGSLYKVDDKTMIMVRDVSDQRFVVDQVLNDKANIYNKMDVEISVKLKTTKILYNLNIYPIAESNGEINIDSLDQYVSSGNHNNNKISIRLMDEDSFTVELIEIPLRGKKTIQAGDEGNFVGYIYEGVIELDPELIQSIKQVSPRSLLEDK